MITLPSWLCSVESSATRGKSLWLGEEVGQEDADTVPGSLMAQLGGQGETNSVVGHYRQGITNSTSCRDQVAQAGVKCRPQHCEW